MSNTRYKYTVAKSFNPEDEICYPMLEIKYPGGDVMAVLPVSEKRTEKEVRRLARRIARLLNVDEMRTR